MSLLSRLPFVGRRSRRRIPEVEAAARARRARDHLARKRERERKRLVRARARAEYEAQRRQSVRVLSPLAFVLAIFAGLAFTGPVLDRLLFDETRLERIAVQGASVLSAAQVAATTGLLAGTPLSQVETAQIRARLEAEPWIEEALVLRLPSGTMVVRVDERAAIARWPRGGAAGWVDARGQRFAAAEAPPADLPRIASGGSRTGTESDAGDETLSDDALAILRALREHAALSVEPAALTLHLPTMDAPDEDAPDGLTQGFVLQLGESGPRALLGRRLFSQRIARLASLVEFDAATLETAGWIDLRYADRAVLRAEPSSG